MFYGNAVDGEMDAEAEEPQRKRQRTSSPDHASAQVLGWKDQLKEAVNSTPSPPKQVGKNPVNEDSTERLAPKGFKDDVQGNRSLGDLSSPTTQASNPLSDVVSKAPTPGTPPKRMLRVRPDGKLASPKALATETVGPTGGQPSSTVSGEQGDSAALKKTLKIHADGKLRSPRAAKREGRQKISKTGAEIKTCCVVTIKYGADKDARDFIGRRVNEILLGSNKNHFPASSKPFEPAKTTHPFFTSKRVPNKDQTPEQSSKSEVHGSQALLAREVYGPRESRIISKPPVEVQEVTSLTSGPAYPTFGTDSAKVTRFPGARDPIWPPCGMLHVGQDSGTVIDRGKLLVGAGIATKGRKLKNAEINILPKEDILNDLANLVHLNENNHEMREILSRGTRKFRRPRRKVMTGYSLQQAIHSRVVSNLPSVPANGDQELAALNQSSGVPGHQALLHTYGGIRQSHTAFDLFRCETQEWAHKYSPRRAEHVLQEGSESLMLRDWLKASTVSSLEHGAGHTRIRDSSAAGSKYRGRAGRKVRRKAKELEGFVVSSDEEEDNVDEIRTLEKYPLEHLHESRPPMGGGGLHSGERNANAIVISGPHGCGKTAAVFAAARELGFAIFEVNAGSRRSGKDILDKVGDMTRNHLVKHRQSETAKSSIEQALEPNKVLEKLDGDPNSEPQVPIASFAQMKPVSSAEKTQDRSKDNTGPSDIRGKKSKPKKTLQETTSQPREHKQSLILLEEVDVLFEEDKLFWATTIDLMVRSKRPVIMTCSDESLLPLDATALYTILRFAPPPEQLATDYLLLVAASEGHLLSRGAVQRLYAAKGFDLRASLTELNFYCQMGVGDRKGGLEWMHIKTPGEDTRPESQPSRVVSEDTYCDGMGWLGGEDISGQSCRTLDEIRDLCTGVWNGWGLDIGAADGFAPTKINQELAMTREGAWHSLQLFDQSCEAFSAADNLPASIVRHDGNSGLDLEQPVLMDKARSNYIESRTLLQAEPLVDFTGMSESAATALRASAILTGKDTNGSAINVSDTIGIIPRMVNRRRSPPQMSMLKFWSAFQAIAQDPLVLSGVSKSSSISVFDSPISLVAIDVAPYVRAIVSYDLQLEKQRRQLSSSLMTQPGAGGKKTRTTRASRAALEGGSKANTRRERWFPENTDFDAVLETGGKKWQDAALRVLLEQPEAEDAENDESGRSSLTRDSDLVMLT